MITHTTKTTPFMVFSVMYAICEGFELDAYMSQSVMPANCRYDFIRQHKVTSIKQKIIYIYDI